MREITVEKYLCNEVKRTSGEVRKLVFAGYRGAPDRLVGWPNGAHHFVGNEKGVHVLVELKKPKGPGAEAHQLREHKRLRAIGFDVRVIHTKEQVDDFILEMTT